jgi:hypothetical protein
VAGPNTGSKHLTRTVRHATKSGERAEALTTAPFRANTQRQIRTRVVVRPWISSATRDAETPVENSYRSSVSTAAAQRWTGLPSIVMPHCLPPAAGVSTTLCGPDATWTFPPQFGHVSVYTRGTVSTTPRSPLGSASVEYRSAAGSGVDQPSPRPDRRRGASPRFSRR